MAALDLSSEAAFLYDFPVCYTNRNKHAGSDRCGAYESGAEIIQECPGLGRETV